MEEQEKTTAPLTMHKAGTVGLRITQAICVAAFVFGLMWEGSIGMELRLSQFLVLYGGIGALVSEALVRILMAKSARFQTPAKPKRGRPRKA